MAVIGYYSKKRSNEIHILVNDRSTRQDEAIEALRKEKKITDERVESLEGLLRQAIPANPNISAVPTTTIVSLVPVSPVSPPPMIPEPPEGPPKEAK